MKSGNTRSLMTAFAMLLIWAASLAGPNVQDATAAPGSGPIAFVHVTVIPMDAERIVTDQTVIVDHGAIVEIGPAARIKVPKGALVVDAAGKYLLPAFCDMHVHLLGEAWNMMLPPAEQLARQDVPWDTFLFPYVANGVTTVQDLFSPPELIALRGRIARGDVVGPRLILARMIDGPMAWPPPLGVWVRTPEEAREAVRQAKKDGYDKIKVYSFLDKPSYDAIVSTAKELGMDVIGHIPMSLSLEYVLDSGQKLIAHTEEVSKHLDGDYRPERIDAVADLMAKRGVWMTPTLIATESIIEIFDDPTRLAARPEAAYYRHSMEQGTWTFMLDSLYKPIPDAGRKNIRDAFVQFQRPFTLAVARKGGKLMAGSDTVLPGLVPGFALHRELRELVTAGLTPYQALRTATTAPYDYLGEGAVAGTIAKGRRSDLVLLDANPLTDISNASKISGVMMRGRWIGAAEIQTKMQAIADAGAH